MKKKVKIMLLVLIFVVIAVLIAFISYKYIERVKINENNKKIIMNIKKAYSEYVSSNEDKKLYIKEEDNYKEIGTIYKGTVVSLLNKEVNDKDDIYYQIKDSNYFLDYYNLKKEKPYQVDTSLDKYIVTKTIKTNTPKLYKDDVLKIELNDELQLDLLMIDNDKYYVKYLNNIYYLKEDYELINKDVEVELLQNISVLNFSDDISVSKFEETLKYLNENKYKSITIDDFIKWVNKQVNLENNKVLLLSYKKLNEEKKNIQDKYGFNINTDLNNISFTSGDTQIKVDDKKYYKYEITSNTSLDRIKDMLNGVKEKKPVSVSGSGQGIAVLNYHFFYDSSIGEGCNESICLDVSNFRKQLDYLKANGYKTLTMQEFNNWMDKKISLPQKSVLLTIDDGAMGTSFINGNKLIPILEEYQMHATLFLITGWWDLANYKSDYLEVESHGDELHHNNFCRDNSCGYKALKLTKDELIQDLNISIQKLGTNLAFCYPFYAKSNNLVAALKETGFQLAFAGGSRKARQSDDKYNIPRYVIYKNTSMSSFESMIK